MFQFTHPGGVRQYGKEYILYLKSVSIHAPGRGATDVPAMILYPCKVSIHAPGRGATGLWIVDFEIGMVSIHAPGRGATLSSR